MPATTSADRGGGYTVVDGVQVTLSKGTAHRHHGRSVARCFALAGRIGTGDRSSYRRDTLRPSSSARGQGPYRRSFTRPFLAPSASGTRTHRGYRPHGARRSRRHRALRCQPQRTGSLQGQPTSYFTPYAETMAGAETQSRRLRLVRGVLDPQRAAAVLAGHAVAQPARNRRADSFRTRSASAVVLVHAETEELPRLQAVDLVWRIPGRWRSVFGRELAVANLDAPFVLRSYARAIFSAEHRPRPWSFLRGRGARHRADESVQCALITMC